MSATLRWRGGAGNRLPPEPKPVTTTEETAAVVSALGVKERWRVNWKKPPRCWGLGSMSWLYRSRTTVMNVVWSLLSAWPRLVPISCNLTRDVNEVVPSPGRSCALTNGKPGSRRACHAPSWVRDDVLQNYMSTTKCVLEYSTIDEHIHQHNNITCKYIKRETYMMG